MVLVKCSNIRFINNDYLQLHVHVPSFQGNTECLHVTHRFLYLAVEDVAVVHATPPVADIQAEAVQ